MVTIYDLLEVDEKASKEEIEKSYQRLILEYGQDPKLTPKENADNEIILNKVKIAYEILINDEKRAIYDKDLSKKRAEELIKNVSVTEEKVKEEPKVQQENLNETNNSNQYNDDEYDDGEDEEELNFEDNQEEVVLSKEEQKRVQKAAQNEFKANLKKAQKAEEEYNKAYNEDYNSYMRKIGYKVKEPISLKRIMNIVIFIIATIIVCAIAWIIPPIRNLLINLYNENIIIKALVDIVGMLFEAIISVFKK